MVLLSQVSKKQFSVKLIDCSNESPCKLNLQNVRVNFSFFHTVKGLLQFVTFMRFPHPFSLFSRFVICILCPYLEDKRTLTEINDVVGSHFFLLGVKYEMFPVFKGSKSILWVFGEWKIHFVKMLNDF